MPSRLAARLASILLLFSLAAQPARAADAPTPEQTKEQVRARRDYCLEFFRITIDPNELRTLTTGDCIGYLSAAQKTELARRIKAGDARVQREAAHAVAECNSLYPGKPVQHKYLGYDFYGGGRHWEWQPGVIVGVSPQNHVASMKITEEVSSRYGEVIEGACSEFR